MIDKSRSTTSNVEYALEENWHFRQSDFGFELTTEELFLFIVRNRAAADQDVYPEVITKFYLPKIRQ